MSKATFYEHFDNKEDCIVALHDDATERRAGGDAAHRRGARRRRPAGRVRAVIHTFLEVLAAFPDEAQTLLVEIIGAGPRAMEHRDRVLHEYATYVDDVNREDAERGGVPRFASPHDAFAIVGAVVELASRQIRTGEPDDIRDLEPVVERLILGLLLASSAARGVSGELAALDAAVYECRRCPRLVDWREQVAREKRAAFRDETYWGRPISGFGDPAARILLLGLAPAAHGGNRTGRVFTGDRSGDFLFAALHRTGFANQPESIRARRRAGAHRLLRSPRPCAARRPPTSRSRPSATTAPPGWSAEWALLERVRVIVCLGGFAWAAALRLVAPGLRPAPRSATAPRPARAAA